MSCRLCQSTACDKPWYTGDGLCLLFVIFLNLANTHLQMCATYWFVCGLCVYLHTSEKWLTWVTRDRTIFWIFQKFVWLSARKLSSVRIFSGILFQCLKSRLCTFSLVWYMFACFWVFHFHFPLSNRKTMATGPCWMNNCLVALQHWKKRDRARCLPPHQLLENRQQAANHVRQCPVFLEQSNVPRPALREGREAKRTLSLLLSRLESCCKSPRLSFAHWKRDYDASDIR